MEESISKYHKWRYSDFRVDDGTNPTHGVPFKPLTLRIVAIYSETTIHKLNSILTRWLIGDSRQACYALVAVWCSKQCMSTTMVRDIPSVWRVWFICGSRKFKRMFTDVITLSHVWTCTEPCDLHSKPFFHLPGTCSRFASMSLRRLTDL